MDNHPHEFVHDDHQVSQQSVKEGYEVSDLQAHLAAYSLIGLFVLLFVMGVIFSIFYLKFMQANIVPPLSYANPQVGMVESAPQVKMDFPTLQMNPERDKDAFVKAEAAHLNSFGKVTVEAEGGAGELVHAHIPIANAMAMVASGKAPYRQQPKVALEAGAVETGDAAADDGGF